MSEKDPNKMIVYGEFTLDPISKRVFSRRGVDKILLPLDYNLLEKFTLSVSGIVREGPLLHIIYGPEDYYKQDSKVLEKHMNRLRKILRHENQEFPNTTKSHIEKQRYTGGYRLISCVFGDLQKKLQSE